MNLASSQLESDEMYITDFQRFSQIAPILRCPVSGETLTVIDQADAELLLREASIAGLERVTGALLARKSGWTYLIRGRIIDLRVENAVGTNASAVAARIQSDASQEVRASVQKWYDSFGWRRNDEGVLNDTAYFSQNDATDHGWYEMSSHLALVDRFGGGRFLLDAASGAIAHPEYLTYSCHHTFRVCVDFSETALMEASSRIGDHGFCVLADICQLPFADDSFEGVISGYTVQHIHKDQQNRAVEELFRVLCPGNHLCMMTGIRVGKLHKFCLMLARFGAKAFSLGRSLDRSTATPAAAGSIAPLQQLYCHYWGFEWWRDIAGRLSPNSAIHCLRLFSKSEFSGVVHSRTGVRTLRAIESLFSLTLARASYFVVVDVAKQENDR